VKLLVAFYSELPPSIRISSNNNNSDSTVSDGTTTTARERSSTSVVVPAGPQIVKKGEAPEYGDTSRSSIQIKTWNDWPAVAHEETNHPLVFKGENFVARMRDILFEQQQKEDAKRSNTAITTFQGKNKKGQERTIAAATETSATITPIMNEFLQAYKNRPDKVNKCGILINHALALFFAVKELKPTLVVESGVNAGQSTYFIRAASSETKIWALDPLENPICDQASRWIDTDDKTTYFVGDDFIDLTQHEWGALAANGTIEVDRTLFFIDDHMETIPRMKHLVRAGMKHLVVEDNYKVNEGASNQDRRGYTPKQAFMRPDRKVEAKWLFKNIVSYAEFPPLVPPIMAKKAPFERKTAGGFMVWQDTNEDIVAPLLRPDLNEQDGRAFHEIADALELNPDMTDFESYKQFMNYNQICYMEFSRQL
jgi:hypothetical protein